MRLLYALVMISVLSACSTTKPTQEYDARVREKGGSRQADPQDSGSRQTSSRQVAPVSSSPAAAQNAAKAAGEWTVTSVKGKYLIIDSSSVRVYLNLTARQPDGSPVTNPSDLSSRFQIAYVLYPDYNNRDRLGYGNVPLNDQTLVRDGDHLTLTFDIKRPKDVASAVLLTEMTEVSTGAKARNDLPVRFRAVKLSDRYALFDKNGRLPQLRNYVNQGDTVVIRSVEGNSKPLFVFRYKHEFDAASSPMNTSSRPASRSLDVDTTLRVTTNQPFTLPKEGLYYFMEDTTDAYGIGLVVTDKRFPKMTRPDKLIKPVLYMSTGSEISELNQAQDTKKAFDRYWLSLMSGNEDVAKRTIKAYFDRVEEANRLFTSYKEGWKTDKGMIYIVLGPPDRVQRNREREVWVYNRRANVSEITFTFTKKPNQFVEDHYELVRYIEYQPIWYPIVEAWRTGAIRE
ncbi:hypothetical protein BN8_04882 [Fibrisoma limi BUZ 3]|uniref:GWxTD domain-containing protein n=1 Tax=Fibrisoma limi BUZ 3 TaxID=1185876 RepID=I2GNY5_9BACT|nr:GWxTD domain-containing protein [Fibrisoma limi]CCH55613.1 hypothetical protein BN8_04882 [Fibrisoma limi BUZ 3]